MPEEAIPPNEERPQHTSHEDAEGAEGAGQKNGKRSSRMLVFVMLGFIVLSIVAFLVFRPDPSGSGHDAPPAATDH